MVEKIAACSPRIGAWAINYPEAKKIASRLNLFPDYRQVPFEHRFPSRSIVLVRFLESGSQIKARYY